MEKKSRFRIGQPTGAIPTDPESLFRDLKQRSPKIQYLWSHQADVLRTWHHDNLNAKDIALELPTGTGKTLIGLLIAEYRRQVFNERVLYLCLTRQLAYQVQALAQEYGIQTYILVGDQTQYPPASFGAYASSRAVGITTYSGVFNTNPRLSDANCLVLDDAHSAEGYIASLWSIAIDRYDQQGLYDAVLDVFRDALREQFVSTLESRAPDPIARRTVDKVPFPTYLERLDKVSNVLEQVRDNSIRYPWTMVRDHMHACNIFISWSSICIRPIIPPTLTHPPFASANQRVYMSATLGAGGELERIIGVPNISRLPVPEGWDRQSTGRRFFIAPGYALDEGDVDKVLWQSIGAVDRALVICSDRLSADRFQEGLAASGISRTLMFAQHIEESLEPFTSCRKAVLLLAGRYDGLDLAGEACRLLVVLGLPAAHDAQEEFLLTRLRATSLLRDRIRTRLSQAFGRCTRGPTDYAAVLLVGTRLVDFCSKREVKSTLHPELQAELEYGLQMSAVNKLKDWADLLQAFLKQDEDWRDADDWIRKYRDKTTRSVDTVAQSFLSVASQEVEYLYDLWRDDYNYALVKARGIADALSGNEMTGYRAWWYYLAGSVAWLIAQTAEDESYYTVAKDLFTRAARCPTAVSWFASLTRMKIISELEQEVDELMSYAMENIEEELTRLALIGPKFERSMNEFLSLIGQDEHKPFERGLEALGKLLGFVTSRPQVQGAPDCLWQLSDQVCIGFEAKSEESLGDPVSIGDARQTKGHLDWIRANVKLSRNPMLLVELVSPRSTISTEALPHAEGIHRISVEDVRALAQKACSMLRNVRARSTEAAEEQLRKNIHETLLQERLDPENLLQFLRKTRLQDLPKV